MISHPNTVHRWSRSARVKFEVTEGAKLSIVIGFVLVLIAIVWLQNNPEGWVLLVLAFGALVAVGYSLVKGEKNRRAEAMLSMAKELDRLAEGFHPIEGNYLSLRDGEYIFYERDQVELREFKSVGRSFNAGYGGLNFRLTQNLSISGGGVKGKSLAMPEESKTIDVGSATFTNDRVIFVGPNHTREWDLDKLLGLAIGENGFEVAAAVSGRHKTSARAGDSLGMITPGIAFALAAELHSEGRSKAKQLAHEISKDIRTQAAEFYRKTSTTD